MKTKFNKSLRIIAIVLFTIITSSSYAQPDRQQGPPPIPNSIQIEKLVNDLSKSLSLNADQSKEIENLYVAHFAQLKEKTESAQADRKEMKALKNDFEKKIKALLTKEQQKQFDEFMKNRRPPKNGDQRPKK